MSKIPIELRIEEFLESKERWEEARQEYFKARIVFEALDQLRRLEQEGPDSITFPKPRKGAKASN